MDENPNPYKSPDALIQGEDRPKDSAARVIALGPSGARGCLFNLTILAAIVLAIAILLMFV